MKKLLFNFMGLIRLINYDIEIYIKDMIINITIKDITLIYIFF